MRTCLDSSNPTLPEQSSFAVNTVASQRRWLCTFKITSSGIVCRRFRSAMVSTRCMCGSGCSCDFTCLQGHAAHVSKALSNLHIWQIQSQRPQGIHAAESAAFTSGPVQLHMHLIATYSLIHSFHTFQSAHQVQCCKHSMAALQPALSWDFLHHVSERPGLRYIAPDTFMHAGLTVHPNCKLLANHYVTVVLGNQSCDCEVKAGMSSCRHEWS